MESLAEVSEELVILLNAYIAGVQESKAPLEQIASADVVCTYYQAVGICELLLDAEVDAFFHHLIRSAQTRQWLLGRSKALEAPPLKVCRISNASGLHAALAARQWGLAQEIVRLSMTTWAESAEYEDDFCCAYFLHRYVEDAPAAELEAILTRFEVALEGGASPRLALGRELLARSPEGCARAFDALLDEHAARLTKLKRTSVHATEPIFVPQSAVFVEGLAWLSLMERAGLHTRAEYPYCPSLARKPRYAPFIVSTFPALPL